jgi:hypothetical protein
MDNSPDIYHLKLNEDNLVISGTTFTGIFKLPKGEQFIPYLEILNPNVVN